MIQASGKERVVKSTHKSSLSKSIKVLNIKIILYKFSIILEYQNYK